MSKIGSKPIKIPEGVTVADEGGALIIKGKLGTVKVLILANVKVAMKDGVLNLTINADHKQAHANWGTLGSHIKNAIEGVTTGFSKKLDIQGIGFKGTMEGTTLSLNLGFTHPVKYAAPEGIKIIVEKNIITVTGIDKYLVGQVAAEIRKLKKPEPYQGKGIRYFGEHVRQKAGKKVAGTGTAA